MHLHTAFLLESQSLHIIPSSLISHKCWKHRAERGSGKKKGKDPKQSGRKQRHWHLLSLIQSSTVYYESGHGNSSECKHVDFSLHLESIKQFLYLLITGLKWSEVAQLCPALCDPMDCSLPGSFIHGIFQARIMEWVAISFSRRSPQPRDWIRVSHIVGRQFTIWATREVYISCLKNQGIEGLQDQ